MSIERQSRDSRSALRAFLDRHLPGRREIAEMWRRQVWACDVRVDGDRAHLGQALELRIGLDLLKRSCSAGVRVGAGELPDF